MPLVRRAHRVAFGFFCLYLTVMTLTMLSPTVFGFVFGGFGLAWPAAPNPELSLLANMNLCGLVPMAFMAGRAGFAGCWTTLDRGFFLVMLGANLAANAWSVGMTPEMIRVFAPDTAVVLPLAAFAFVVPARGAA